MIKVSKFAPKEMDGDILRDLCEFQVQPEVFSYSESGWLIHILEEETTFTCSE